MTAPLRCPSCEQPGLLPDLEGHGDRATVQPRGLVRTEVRCPSCGQPVPQVGGLLDLAPHVPLHDPSLDFKQRVMNSRPFACLYESFLWRPLHTRLSSGQSLEQEISELLGLAGDRAPRVAVDLACGTGHYARAMALRHPGAQVLGIDISPAMLEQGARRPLPNLRYVRGDLRRLPLADASVDHVNCAGTLHLFADPMPVLREIVRVLAPGGVFTLMAAGMPKPEPGTFRERFERRAALQPLVPAELQVTLEGLGLRDVQRLQRRMILLLSARRPEEPT